MRIPLILIWIWVISGGVLAQPDLEVCSSPALDFGGENGTPVSISDSLVINEDLLIEDLHVSVDISHGFVADLLVDVVSPSGTALRLHDGLGGDLDDLRVIFSDEGVENGVPRSCTSSVLHHASIGTGCRRAPGGYRHWWIPPYSVATPTVSTDWYRGAADPPETSPAGSPPGGTSGT